MPGDTWVTESAFGLIAARSGVFTAVCGDVTEVSIS